MNLREQLAAQLVHLAAQLGGELTHLRAQLRAKDLDVLPQQQNVVFRG